MAQFNIDSHIGNGKRLEWLALPDRGETVESIVIAVRRAAMKKFGDAVWLKRWTHVVASNGFVTVQMHA
ncbi:hypothetical protein CS390_15275 [Pseudomonas sp. HLS-6]|uniref:hypothetical protein n=1 Tax=Pseudomonas sp. HLS-6 TaxID=2049589 RepID=UPI000C17B1DA|nr:hypothetical protein [Pseudomonas sp. HLS-6]ATR83804.1 hypothetical protein CS390_15275 [Pseudomonas sp. HLS-6]